MPLSGNESVPGGLRGEQASPIAWCGGQEMPAGNTWPTDSPIFLRKSRMINLSQKLKLIHRASIHPVHSGELSFSPTYGQISRNHAFCRCGCLPWTWLGRIANFIGIWVLSPLKTSGGQAMAFGGFGICLGGYFLSWIVIHECWALKYQWQPASGIWTVRQPQTPQNHKPAQFKQTCLSSLILNGSSPRWVMYKGFLHLGAETRAAELHWSFLFLVNLVPLKHPVGFHVHGEQSA